MIWCCRPLVYTVSVLLPAAYIIGLIFTLKTHSHIYDIHISDAYCHGTFMFMRTRCLVMLIYWFVSLPSLSHHCRVHFVFTNQNTESNKSMRQLCYIYTHIFVLYLSSVLLICISDNWTWSGGTLVKMEGFGGSHCCHIFDCSLCRPHHRAHQTNHFPFHCFTGLYCYSYTLL